MFVPLAYSFVFLISYCMTILHFIHSTIYISGVDCLSLCHCISLALDIIMAPDCSVQGLQDTKSQWSVSILDLTGIIWHNLSISFLEQFLCLPFGISLYQIFFYPCGCSLSMPFAGSASYSKSFSGGVPQESVLGLFFFCLHSCLGNLVQSFEFHLYELPQIYFFSLGFSPEYLTLSIERLHSRHLNASTQTVIPLHQPLPTNPAPLSYFFNSENDHYILLNAKTTTVVSSLIFSLTRVKSVIFQCKMHDSHPGIKWACVRGILMREPVRCIYKHTKKY